MRERVYGITLRAGMVLMLETGATDARASEGEEPHEDPAKPEASPHCATGAPEVCNCRGPIPPAASG